ncbi:hypothetical protein HS125_16075 [bacterium]|nr:hypothetical protein [bacterium]
MRTEAAVVTVLERRGDAVDEGAGAAAARDCAKRCARRPPEDGVAFFPILGVSVVRAGRTLSDFAPPQSVRGVRDAGALSSIKRAARLPSPPQPVPFAGTGEVAARLNLVLVRHRGRAQG